jgi:putative transferase (TIGR04331 family)
VEKEFESMTSRFLVTTALESTWKTDVPLLFVGSWCMDDAREKLWSQLDYKVVPYHWDDVDVLVRDDAYCTEVYEDLLARLVDLLNAHHHIQWSLRAWRIVIGFWLRRYVTILYDRYRSVETAVEQFSISGASCLEPSEAGLVSTDSADFSRLYKTDEWNHRLYSQIILRFPSIKPEYGSHGAREAAAPHPASAYAVSPRSNPVTAEGLRQWARSTVRNLLKSTYRSTLVTSTIRLLSHRNRFYVYMPYLSSDMDELRLSYRLGDVPVLQRTTSNDRSTTASYDPIRRSQLKLENNAPDPFRQFTVDLLPEMLPICYLEGLDSLVSRAGSRRFPKRPSAIFTAAGLYYDEVFKVWTAGQVDRGVPFVVGQHGGHYAAFKIDSESLPHELAVCDRYFSWGWELPHENVTPVPALLLINKRYGEPRTDGKIVIVGRPMNRYCTALTQSTLPGVNNSGYYERLEQLIGKLRDAGVQDVVARLHPGEGEDDEKGISIERRLRRTFDPLDVAPKEVRLAELFASSRLNICTYFGTPLLESIGLDCPTLLIHDLVTEPFSDLAAPIYEQLRKVGIFHDSVDSAVRHIEAISGDIRAWWDDERVVGVKRAFRHQFVRGSDNGLGELSLALKAVARSGRHRYR